MPVRYRLLLRAGTFALAAGAGRGQAAEQGFEGQTASTEASQLPNGSTTSATLEEQTGGASPQQLSADDIFRRAFGGSRPELPASEYPVLVNEVLVGEFRVQPDRGSVPGTVESEFLVTALCNVVEPQTAGALKRLANASGQIAFEELRHLGFEVHFDAVNVALHVGVPPRLGTIQDLRLRRTRPAAETQIVQLSDISGYASLRIGAAIIEDGAMGRRGVTRKAGELDLVGNLFGVVGQASLRYRDSGRRALTRGDARLTYDDTANLIRYEVGDLSIARRSFQSGPRIAGISVFRNFGIDPYRNIRPSFSQSFELTEPARVETLVNGVPSRSFNLRGGRYTLRDIPLASSAGNDVELRITYLGGTTEVLRFPAFFDFDLLAPGLVDFGVNLGVPYRDTDGLRRYDSSTHSGSAYVRYGLNSELTLGLNWEGNAEFDLAGGDAVWASPVGTFAAYLSTHVRNPRLNSSQMTLSYRWRDSDRLRDRFVDATLVLTGRDYRTLNDLFGNSYIARQVRLRGGQRLSGRVHAQLFAGHEKVRLGNEEGYYLGANASHQLSFGALSVGAEYQWSKRQPGPAVRVALTVPLGRGSLSSSYTTDDNSLTVDYAKASAGGVGSVAVNAGLSRRDGAEELYGGISYIGNRFEASVAQVASSYFSRWNERNLHTDVTFGTALVMADGHFGISRPVTNSFALFRSHPGAGHLDLAVDPRTEFGSTRTSYEAQSGALGPAVVPNLSPYFVRGVQVDAPDAPAGTPIGGQVYLLRPGYRSGYSIVVGSEASVSVVGNLVDRGGDPLAFATGTAAPHGEPITADQRLQLFSNRAGRFFLEGLVPGKRYDLALVVNGQQVVAQVDVPKDAIGLVRIEAPIHVDVDGEKENVDVDR